MRYLICLALLGCTLGSPLKVDSTQTEVTDRATLYILPRESFPSFYDVTLFFDPSNSTLFTGSVAIRVIPNSNTQSIVMHAMELDILSIRASTDIDPGTDLFSNFTLATDDTHFLRINFNRNLLALTPINVVIDFVGRYAPDMFGVYISSYTDANGNTVNLVTSQLQPTFARRAFPCYDEPDVKAVFRITVYSPPQYTTVRGNMPLRTDLLKPEVASFTKHEFEDTLVMSTYLLAFLVSNLDYIDNAANPLYDIPFRVYSRPGTQTTAEFALDYGQRNMAALEEYTEFAYAFPKMDHVAVPDFAAGAMENWGLVIYREVALLVQDGVTTTAVKQNIGRIICHENVHQWFGNEVGPLSWTYTWLNEGFANFFENFATDLVLPEWRMMDQFVATMHSTFQSDAVLTINPMTHEVYSPSEIIGTFNAIAYQKSGSVIRMAQHFLTPEVFRRGLVIYIQNMSRRAAAPLNLFNSLQQALDESNHTIPYTVTNVLNRWTTQGGFPVITVRRTSNSAESIYITQQRYLTDTSLSSSDRWHIPINWVLSTDADFSDTRPQGWVWTFSIAQHFDIPGLSQADWFLVNKQQTGYYRVNYDPENWAALARVLVTSPSTIHVLNRAQLVDDVFNMARTGRLDYSYALDLSRYLHLEEDYIPWASANLAFTYLDVVLSGSSVYNLYQAYVQNLTAPMFAALGFEAASAEEHVTPYHRNIVLNWNCRYGNQDCVGAAQQMLQDYRNDPTQSMNPDIQTVVFCSGLRGGDEGNFNFLWEQYLASSDASQQSILLNALGCTSNPTLREFYLNQVISDDSSVREQDRHTIIVAVTNSGHENMEVALDFVIEHFNEIQPRVQGLTGTTNILNAFAARLTTQEHSDKIEAFYARYSETLSAGERASVGAIRENIAASVTWSSRHLAAVEGWLRANVSAAPALTAQFLTAVAVVVTMFNVL